MNIDTLIEEYFKSEEINPKHHKRLLSRKNQLYKFIEFLSGKGLDEVIVKDALEYQGWLIRNGNTDGSKYSSSTIRGYIVSISGFYNYLKSINVVYENPFKSVKRLRIDRTIPRNILTEKNMSTLLEYYRNWNNEKHLKKRKSLYRMHLISELMYSTGLRVNEVAKLKVTDIDLSNKTLFVKEGKGGFSRTAILNEYTKDILSIYINQMREITFTQDNRENGNLLFGLSEDSFKKCVNVSLEKATNTLGLKKMTSHGFRHALGYHLLRSGCNIRYIQSILGHKNLRNTEIYTKVDKEDLKKVLQKYHPRQFKRISDETNNKKIEDNI